MPWTVYSRREATSRAAQALIMDPRQSDLALAGLADCSFTTIARVRARLEQVGVIPRIEPADRIARPRPQQPSATADAIEALGPDATPRQVADAAGVSMAAAWKALSKVRPRLSDAAAATDALTVVKMPRQLEELAAATDQLSVQVTITCTCGTTFHVSAADSRARRRRFCSPACSDAANRELNHATRPRKADPSHPPPQIQPLPPMPEEIRLGGLCTQPDLRPAHRYVWTSDREEDREIARRYCRACSVRMICMGWSLSLPVTDNAIWGGMSQTERLRRKREAGLGGTK